LNEGDIWSQDRCDTVFAGSISARYEPALDRFLGTTAINQDQRDALISFIYNVGTGGLEGNVGRAVKEGRHGDVPKFLARWNKCNGRELAGLTRRRKAEGQLYAGDVEAAMLTAQTAIPGGMPQNRERPRPTVRELARETPKLAGATVGAGSGTTAVPASKAPSPKSSMTTGEWIAVALGAAITGALIVVLVRKWRGLAADWA